MSTGLIGVSTILLFGTMDSGTRSRIGIQRGKLRIASESTTVISELINELGWCALDKRVCQLNVLLIIGAVIMVVAVTAEIIRQRIRSRKQTAAITEKSKLDISYTPDTCPNETNATVTYVFRVMVKNDPNADMVRDVQAYLQKISPSQPNHPFGELQLAYPRSRDLKSGDWLCFDVVKATVYKDGRHEVNIEFADGSRRAFIKPQPYVITLLASAKNSPPREKNFEFYIVDENAEMPYGFREVK